MAETEPKFSEDELRFRTDASVVLARRVDQVHEISRSLLDVTDTDAAEAMWLACRRLRAALELFRPVLSQTQFPAVRDEVRQMIRAVGRRRDIDSQIVTFGEIAAEMDPVGKESIDLLVASLREAQADGNRSLAQMTNGRRLQALRVRVEDLTGQQYEGEEAEPAWRSPEVVPGSASRIVSRRLARLRSSVPEALEPDASREQQRMRVAAERLRYSLELTAEALGSQAHTARRAARGLQEVLGEMRDCDLAVPVARERLALLEAEDVAAIADRGRGSRELDPLLVQAAPNRMLYRGPQLAIVHLRARRSMLFERFRRLWLEQSRQGVWVALEASLENG